MDTNMIIVAVIVALVGVILVFGIYFTYVYFYNKKHKKKIDSLFDVNNLVEEESLMNVMDDKRNVDFKNEEKNDKFTFVSDTEVEIAESDVMKEEEKINPFGVDLSNKTYDNKTVDYIKEEEERASRKFF